MDPGIGLSPSAGRFLDLNPSCETSDVSQLVQELGDHHHVKEDCGQVVFELLVYAITSILQQQTLTSRHGTMGPVNLIVGLSRGFWS